MPRKKLTIGQALGFLAEVAAKIDEVQQDFEDQADGWERKDAWRDFEDANYGPDELLSELLRIGKTLEDQNK